MFSHSTTLRQFPHVPPLRGRTAVVFLCLLAVATPAQPRGATGSAALTFEDMMHFRRIYHPAIANSGTWVAFAANPDRGDGGVVARATGSEKTFTIVRGSAPRFSEDSRWLAAARVPPAIELEKQQKEKNKPAPGFVLLNLDTGDSLVADSVQSFSFSNNSRWLAYHKHRPGGKEKTGGKDTTGSTAVMPVENIGSRLVLHELASGRQTTLPWVLSFQFDTTSTFLAVVRGDSSGMGNALLLVDLRREDLPVVAIDALPRAIYSALRWSANGRLACIRNPTSSKNIVLPGTLLLWDQGKDSAEAGLSPADIPEGWMIPSKNDVAWSRDGSLVFLGLRPFALDTTVVPFDSAGIEKGFFNVDSILSKKEVDVWHWDDPFIIPHQKKQWKQVRDQTLQAVYLTDDRRVVQLADSLMPYLSIPENTLVALGRSDVPYRKEVTWRGTYNDFYLVNLRDGTRKRIAKDLDGGVSLSPGGNYAAFFQKKQWHLYDVRNDSTRVLTGDIEVPFFDPEHDAPSPAPDFGLAGWLEGDSAVMIYDQYDIWEFPTAGGRPFRVTDGDGRSREVRYRIKRLDTERTSFKKNEQLFLSAYSDKGKNTAFYTARAGQSGVRRLVDEPAKFTFLAKAKNADAIFYTRESYSEFPDLWVSPLGFRSPKKMSDVNPQVKNFAWGTAELVSWLSLDGTPLQGVLIKPGTYQPGKRYPVLVYFYERMSQLLFDFNTVEINHRPCFPFYASNGYALFLPDVRYTIGEPGYSATKCVVPGVQKLIEMGVADPNAIALHGHSWGGYETAFMVTQTDLFAAAIAGAPVANMTSAYDGIRWESGLARQFQYEQQQSRIGGSLWKMRDRYIENSPVFFADRIHTPLLIQFGDEDGAVPWYQGIEMYLALRRLGKESYFLEYRGEPHHLKKYPNKLDYSIRFKEFLDHYLKGKPAPVWMTSGVPYTE
jgi:dipeptidyl aminopeptidase/acylaminoacyl peptidase